MELTRRAFLVAGGIGALTSDIMELRPAYAAVPAAHEKANWFSTILLLGLASVGALRGRTDLLVYLT